VESFIFEGEIFMDYDDLFREAGEFYEKQKWEESSKAFLNAMSLAPDDEEKGICSLMGAMSLLEIVKISEDNKLYAMSIACFKKSADYGNEIALDYLKKLDINYTPQKPSSSSVSNSGGSSVGRVTIDVDKILKEKKSFIDSLRPSSSSKGKMTYPDGSIYEGELKNGKPYGKGKITWNDGTVYEGELVDGKKHGKGKYKWANGDKYEGDFINGQQHGKGKITYKSGAYYEGDYVNGKFEGRGKYVYPNGQIEDGRWKGGEFLGK
jgi:hypothetical protein